MEMVSNVTFQTFRSFLAILCDFGAIWKHFWPPKKGRLNFEKKLSRLAPRQFFSLEILSPSSPILGYN